MPLALLNKLYMPVCYSSTGRREERRAGREENIALLIWLFSGGGGGEPQVEHSLGAEELM